MVVYVLLEKGGDDDGDRFSVGEFGAEILVGVIDDADAGLFHEVEPFGFVYGTLFVDQHVFDGRQVGIDFALVGFDVIFHSEAWGSDQ
jgi:hypothetical protein